jgi:hypothetical protein
MPAIATTRPASDRPASWHAPFLAMRPTIQRCAQRAFYGLPAHDREEAVAAVLALALTAYVRLVELGKPELGYPTVLARYAVRQYRTGRRVGCRLNCRDVASPACQRRSGVSVQSLDDWKLALAEDPRTTPAELAAMRVDFEAWLATLTPRNRQLANVLATGETTSAVARTFRVTAGRISQLRRELFESWRRFVGEAPWEAA